MVSGICGSPTPSHPDPILLTGMPRALSLLRRDDFLWNESFSVVDDCLRRALWDTFLTISHTGWVRVPGCDCSSCSCCVRLRVARITL
ncbi:hypothetical protein RRG08_046052 [Elysia crispata]|uniref:Uncharacterized protein n=1 Tax=Elysia crispata TaxID=231223 RepID=A0AAE1A8J0_9GAST|nr:hypothetical protein RRG08_046052 [Elysia crispata]